MRTIVRAGFSKLHIRFIIFFAIIFFFTSCAQAEPFNTNDFTNLLIRSKNLFSLCSILLGQSDTYLSDVFSRLYYGYYHLGRLIFSNMYGYEKDSHSHVWKKMEEPIKDFGFSMKSLREKYEYRALSLDDIIVKSKEDLLYVVNSNKFDRMIIELKSTLDESDYYSLEEKAIFFEEIKLIEKEHTKLLDKFFSHSLNKELN